jgi:hypothetical protein
MNQDKIDHSAMLDAKIEAILAGEEELIPSSGFLGSVMERVQEEAVAPPPIPFPWRRAIPGTLLTAGVFGWGAVKLYRQGLPALSSSALPLPHLPVALDVPVEQAGWLALALGVTLLSWLLSRRLAGRGGLL